MRTLNTDLGTLEIRSVPLPEGINPNSAIYLPSGRLIINYYIPGEEADRVHLATLNDDGSGFREIFDGPAPMNPLGNGFRIMPFPDNKRAYIGDYVLECEPDLDTADPAKSRMVPVRYPEEIRQMPRIWKVWSEIIVHPDNEHVGFNGLGADLGVYVSKLRRTETEYVHEDVQTISVHDVKPDPEHPGCILSEHMRGGEIKQFVKGGLGASLVGAGKGAGDSVVVSLNSRDVTEITNTPGYDETTIFSPDDKLGLVMSTRFSPKTCAAYIGLIPRRGNMATKSALTNIVYMRAVAMVRVNGGGTIGPALIDIDRSLTEADYMGIDLSDPTGEWIYYSPMSWHPSGRKAMWNEGQKRCLGMKNRVMIAELKDRADCVPTPVSPLPEIPFALPGVDVRGSMMSMKKGEKYAGAFSGTVETTVTPGNPTVARTVYEHFSDDGESFLDGWETSSTPGLITPGESTYEAKLTMTGAHTGEMDLRAAYRLTPDMRVTMTESRGFARYDNREIRMEELL